jgi:hypothetical protein
MKTIVTCPECRRALQVPEEFFGKSVQCPDCKHAFVAQSPEAAVQITSTTAAPSAPAPKPAAPKAAAPPDAPEVWEEPPTRAEKRRRMERDDDDDDLDDSRIGRRTSRGDPDRGGVILALGIVSLVLAFFSFMLYILPIWLIPLVCGIFGWVLGQRDLKAMKAGTMDSRNQVLTLVGMILSIVGVGISACVAVFSCGMMAFLGIIFGIAANAPPPPGPPPRPR